MEGGSRQAADVILRATGKLKFAPHPALRTAFARTADERIHWVRSIPFILVHLVPLLAIWTGATAMDWAICFGLYFVRMFFITGVYHRYFAHRSYRVGRVTQFILATFGLTRLKPVPGGLQNAWEFTYEWLEEITVQVIGVDCVARQSSLRFVKLFLFSLLSFLILWRRLFLAAHGCKEVS